MNTKVGKTVLLLLLLLFALFINPKELYDRLQAEKEADVIRGILSEGEILTESKRDKKYEIKNIKYLGGNDFLVETDSDTLLIQRKRNGSRATYEVYVYEITVQKFFGSY